MTFQSSGVVELFEQDYVAALRKKKSVKFSEDQPRDEGGRQKQFAKAVSEAELAPLVRLAERLEPALRRRFMDALRHIQNSIELAQLAEAIAAGNISRAETLLKFGEWPEKFGGMAVDLRAGFIAGTQIGMRSLSEVGITMAFNLVDSHTVEYARRRMPPLVQSLKDGARDMVRQTMTEAAQGVWTPFEAAQGIKDWLGLTAQQASASAKFERELQERGIPEDKIAVRLAKYEDAQLRQRAETIARTEIMSASNAGQRETWNESVRQGLLPRTAKKVWLTANDERLCPVCESLGNAEPVGLNEQFTFDDGTKASTVFNEPLYEPPQHPNCRCTMVLELEDN